MSIEERRRELIEKLQELIGERNTATLMESLPPQGWNELATKADLDRFATKADLERFATRIELHGEIGQLRGEIAELRAEVHAIVPKLLVASLGSSATLFAFVLGAAAVIR